MTNEQYISHFLENESIIKENKNTKTINYLLVAFLIVSASILAIQLIEEQHNKKQSLDLTLRFFGKQLPGSQMALDKQLQVYSLQNIVVISL